MASAIQTFVLIGWLGSPPGAPIVIPGYGTAAECQAAIVALQRASLWKAICIPGPTEPAR